MSEITMLTVKTDFDDSGLRKLEAKVASALETARRLVEQFNKNAELSISTGAFVKGLQKIDQELKRLRKECDHIEISPDMSTFEETLDWLERRLNSLEKDYLLTIRVNTEELQKAEALVSGLGQKQAGEARQAGIDPHVEIKKLEEEHETAKKLNEQLYASKEEQEANFVETRKKYLEKVQGVLEDAALKEIESDKRAKDETIANIQAVKAELESLSETGIGMKEVVGSIQAINGPLINFTTQLNALHAAETSAKLKSLEKSKERELKLIDESLAAEMAMYEEQLAQYAGLEKEKEDLTKEHGERMEELNSEMQEHLTEEEWLALQERITDETLRYEESMAALQADTLARDEIQAQKEQAEREAAERKAQLEQEYAVRKAKLERKQAEMTRKTNIFQAMVTTAAGVARAFADHAFPMSGVIAALVAAAGAVQIAAIKAQPLPEIPSFYGGGTIGGANIHNYRHLPGPDNPYDKTLFWGQPGEEVLPLGESEAYRALRAQGWSLADALAGRQAASAYSGGSSHIDNSKHVAQNLTIQARNELTFAEARRLARKQNRVLVRAMS